MSEQPLMKDKLSANAVAEISHVLSCVIPDFPTELFMRAACSGLEQLELKQRVTHLIGVLAEFLPHDFSDAAHYLVQVKQHWLLPSQQAGWSSFTAWPLIDYIGVYGLDHPELALDVLEQLTPLFSAEFAVRPFIEQHFDLTHKRLLLWTQHQDQHVRRLASEGCRPRLPWGKQLKHLRAEPEPVFSILEQLKDDSSLYVRKSVANNLNDIAKDHPQKMIALCKKWKIDASKQRQWIIKHALRSLIKAGEPAAFDLLGYSLKPQVTVSHFGLNRQQVLLGQQLELSLELQSHAEHLQSLMVDYKVFHVKANGQLTCKVFKWKTLTLEPMQQRQLVKQHLIKEISTRQYYSGLHRIEVVINGQAYSQAEFYLHC